MSHCSAVNHKYISRLVFQLKLVPNGCASFIWFRYHLVKPSEPLTDIIKDLHLITEWTWPWEIDGEIKVKYVLRSLFDHLYPTIKYYQPFQSLSSSSSIINFHSQKQLPHCPHTDSSSPWHLCWWYEFRVMTLFASEFLGFQLFSTHPHGCIV